MRAVEGMTNGKKVGSGDIPVEAWKCSRVWPVQQDLRLRICQQNGEELCLC